MEWEEPQAIERITKAEAAMQDGECVVTWHWPKGIEAVMIYSFEEGAAFGGDSPSKEKLKLLTREEYKTRAGYRERVGGMGPRGFRVYPCRLQEGRVAPLRQEDEGNIAWTSAGRARIGWSVRYSRAWLSRQRTAQIRVFCELPVPQDALCYVRQEGAMPRSREDGIVYPFPSGFAAGQTVLPEIEIGRRDCLRLFLTDGSKYGGLYELISE